MSICVKVFKRHSAEFISYVALWAFCVMIIFTVLQQWASIIQKLPAKHSKTIYNYIIVRGLNALGYFFDRVVVVVVVLPFWSNVLCQKGLNGWTLFINFCCIRKRPFVILPARVILFTRYVFLCIGIYFLIACFEPVIGLSYIAISKRQETFTHESSQNSNWISRTRWNLFVLLSSLPPSLTSPPWRTTTRSAVMQWQRNGSEMPPKPRLRQVTLLPQSCQLIPHLVLLTVRMWQVQTQLKQRNAVVTSMLIQNLAQRIISTQPPDALRGRTLTPHEKRDCTFRWFPAQAKNWRRGCRGNAMMRSLGERFGLSKPPVTGFGSIMIRRQTKRIMRMLQLERLIGKSQDSKRKEFIEWKDKRWLKTISRQTILCRLLSILCTNINPILRFDFNYLNLYR